MRELFLSFLREEQVLSEPAELEYYGRDVCRQFEPAPLIVLVPDSVEEVCRIVQCSAENHLKIVPSGGRTGTSGGATATQGEVVLSLARLNRVLEVNSVDQTITVQAGVTTEGVRVAAAEHGLFYPVDFYSKGSSHVGGNIATNAGGMRVIRYGNTREWVLGIKVVTASGAVLNLNGKLVKNQTGYDLRHLFIGSEGTLGIVVEATLKLTVPPGNHTVALCGASDPERALQLLERVRRSHTLNVFEYFERSGLELVLAHHPLPDPFQSAHHCYLLIEGETPTAEEEERFQNTLMEVLEEGMIDDAVVAQSSKQAGELFALRELIAEVANIHHSPHKNDISVPVRALPPFLNELRALYQERFPEYRSVIFGHVGDGNLHINVLKPEGVEKDAFFAECHALDEAIFSVVERYHGSISAEHGVGLLKKPYLHYSRTPAEIELMRQIKRAFDPENLFNPGKIFSCD